MVGRLPGKPGICPNKPTLIDKGSSWRSGRVELSLGGIDVFRSVPLVTVDPGNGGG